MAEITKAQADEIDRDREYMRQAGMSEGDIEAYTDQRLKSQGIMLGPGEAATYQPGQTATRLLSPMLGASIGSALTSRMLPIVQTGIEAGGAMLGDMFGRATTGQPQNLKETAQLGAASTILGGGGRILTHVLGAGGGIPRMAVQEAGVPTAGLPSYQKTGLLPGSSPGPRSLNQLMAGESAEAGLADRVRAAADKVGDKITPERLKKVAILKQADASGIKVDPMPVLDKMAEHQVNNAFMPDAVAFNEQTNKAMDNFMGVVSKNGGSLTPSQMDEIIRTQLDEKGYTASGDPTTTRVGAAVRDAKSAATKRLNEALPPGVSKLNQQISAKLDAADEAIRLFGSDRPGVINRLRNLFNPGNEDNIKALAFLAKESGDTNLVKDVLKATTKREFTPDIRVPAQGAGRPVRELLQAGARGATKLIAPLQPYYGGGAAALMKYRQQKSAESQPAPTGTEHPTLWKSMRVKPEDLFVGMTNAPPQEQQ